jgi:hypothetical protein
MIKTKTKDPGEPAVKATIREDDDAAKRVAELCEREKEGKSGSGTWMWWTDESRTDDGRVQAAAVCLNGDGRTAFRCYLSTG